MRPSRLVARFLLPAIASVALWTTAAFAGHVPGTQPLAAFSNHSHEVFTNVVFPPGDYSGINFAFADLSNCTFSPGTNLTGAIFRGAKLINVNLAGCTLDQTDFRGADLSFSTLGCADFADFRGAVLTGAASACGGCAVPGSNAKDDCTTGDVPQLCLAPASFRGLIAGVVFVDANNNGVLDVGESGVPGVTVFVDPGPGPVPVITDGRGSYSLIGNVAGPATVVLHTSTLPAGLFPNATSYAFSLANCRSGQERNFALTDPATPVKQATFGQLKIYYR